MSSNAARPQPDSCLPTPASRKASSNLPVPFQAHPTHEHHSPVHTAHSQGQARRPHAHVSITKLFSCSLHLFARGKPQGPPNSRHLDLASRSPKFMKLRSHSSRPEKSPCTWLLRADSHHLGASRRNKWSPKELTPCMTLWGHHRVCLQMERSPHSGWKAQPALQNGPPTGSGVRICEHTVVALRASLSI